ncbi:MAG TPA: DUF3343 domain-containing protein [Anaerolineae bacterium]
MSGFGVVLFHNTSGVMRAEKVLQKAGVTIKLIPTPREFSSDCGIAVRFEQVDKERVSTLLDQARVETAGMHEMQG